MRQTIRVGAVLAVAARCPPRAESSPAIVVAAHRRAQAVPRPRSTRRQVPRVHGHRHRRHRRQVVQRLVLAGHAGGAGRRPEQDHRQVPAVHLASRLRAEHHGVPRPEVRDHRHRRLPDGAARRGTAAKANPSAKFAIVDYPKLPQTNIDSLVFNTVQDGFLGGYLAAGMTKTGKVATFGGQKLPTVTIYMDGFWDGVQYYNSQHHTHVQVLGWNEKTPDRSVHQQLHQPDPGPDGHAAVHHRRRGHHLPGRRRGRAGRGQGRSERRQRGGHPEVQHDVGGHRRLRQRCRSTASTSSPAWRRASSQR